MLSLYDATVPQFVQILTGTAGLLAKAEAHCVAHDLPESALIGARLYEDMLPFWFQVRSAAGHSAGTIAALGRGEYSPDRSPPPKDFAALKVIVHNALDVLKTASPAEVDAAWGRNMRFTSGPVVLDFTAEACLLSFAMPNFYFHATTAYDILRAQGVSLGKPDFVGPLRFKSL